MFYDIILETSQTMTSKAVSRANSKNNTPLIENNSSVLQTKRMGQEVLILLLFLLAYKRLQEVKR